MPEQEKMSVEKRIFCSGFYTFCVGISLFLRCYRGNFPEVLPPLLIFFASFAFSSYSGQISQKKFFHLVSILIYGGLVLWFRDPMIFALVSGLSAGTFSADSFAALPDKNKWLNAFRSYFYGGIFAIVPVSIGIVSQHLIIWLALVFYSLSVFCARSEKKRSGWAHATFCMILLSIVFYASIQWQAKKSQAVPLEGESDHGQDVVLDAGIFALTHPPVNKTLAIFPDYSKTQRENLPSGEEKQIIFYPDYFSVQEKLENDRNRYDLILVMQTGIELDQYSREFVRLLKQHLTPHGVVVYILPANNLFRASVLRSSMYLNFKHTKASENLRLLAASDLPLKNNGINMLANILEPLLFPEAWDAKTMERAAKIKAPTNSDYSFERAVLSREASNPLIRTFYHYLPLKPVVFLCTVAGLLLIYLITRYMIAYVSGMGLRLTVFSHSVLFFFIAGYLFFSRSLNGYPYGTLYCAALIPLLISGMLGCSVAVKYYRWGLPLLLAVGVISWFLMPYYGTYFTLGMWGRCFMIGFVLPSMLRHSAEKYKTGTVDPSVLFESTGSGLFAAMLLLAMMP